MYTERSVPRAEMLNRADSQGTTWTARDNVLFLRASPTTGSDTNDSTPTAPSSLPTVPPTSSMPSSTTSAPTTSTSDSGIDIPTIHSPVPMVAGSLAGFIAILAAILVIVVVRRRKKRPMSRTLLQSPPLPPFTGGSRSGGIESDDLPDALPHAAGGLRNSLPKPKRGPRYEYAEDVELGRRDSDIGKIREPYSHTAPSWRGRSDTPGSRHSSNFASSELSGYSRRLSSGHPRSSRPRTVGAHAQASSAPITGDGNDFSDSTHPHTTTPLNHAHDRLIVSHSISSSPPHSNDIATDSGSFLPPPSAYSTPSAHMQGKGGEDLPPAYEDVK